MAESILEASKKSKTNGVFGFLKNKWFLITIVILLVGASAWFYFSRNNKEAKTNIQQQKTALVSKGDIKIAIEADGKVVARDGVDLSFSVSGDTLEVTKVFVKEGQTIKKGDKIAQVDAESLKLSVRSAYASYQSALASYNDKLDGATDEDKIKSQNNITQAEISLEQAEVNLERTKSNAENSIKTAEDNLEDAKDDLDYDYQDDYQDDIDDKYKDLVSYLKSIAISLADYLKDSDAIIGVDDKFINDSFESSLGVKNQDTITSSKGSYKNARDAYNDWESQVTLLDFTGHSDVDGLASEAMDVLDLFEDHLYKMQLLLASTITTSNLSQTSLNSYISKINSNRSNINSKISSLDSNIKAVNDALDNLVDYQDDYSEKKIDLEKVYEDTREDLENVKLEVERDIKDAENSVKTKELNLSEAKLSYQELLAPLTGAELASAKSQLTSSAVSLERANNELDGAILISPIDGEIALLNYKTGDTILKDDSRPVVSIINNDTLFIEVAIEESDISGLEVGQRAIATFDALDGAEFEGKISFISMTSETSNNGIVTYLVRVLFENTGDISMREGMTASVEFITDGVEDVISIPVDAVKNVAGKPSVRLENGEWVEVITGFTDGDDVEVINGLNVGDKIIY